MHSFHIFQIDFILLMPHICFSNLHTVRTLKYVIFPVNPLVAVSYAISGSEFSDGGHSFFLFYHPSFLSCSWSHSNITMKAKYADVVLHIIFLIHRNDNRFQEHLPLRAHGLYTCYNITKLIVQYIPWLKY